MKRQWGLIFALALFVPIGAAAQPSGDGAADDEDPHGIGAMRDADVTESRARSHFRVATALYGEGRFVEAAEEFLAAYELSERPQLLFNAYLAFRDAGDLARATDALGRYLEADPNAPQFELLSARLAAMRGTLAERQAAEASSEAERQRLEEERRRLEEERAYHAERAAAAEAAVEERSSPVPYIILGTGGAMLAGAVVTGVIANGRVSDLEDACPGDRCPEEFDLGGERTSARRTVIATDVLLAGGVAVAATGAVLAIVQHNRHAGAGDDEDEARVRVGAACGPTGCSVALQGSF